MIASKYSPIIISITTILTFLGLWSAFTLPNALLPRIDRPEIILFTSWNGKSAQEIEQTLVAPLEQQVYGMDNLMATQSTVTDDVATTTLTFHADVDMQQMYIEVMSRVNQVPGWPPQVAKPAIVNNASGAGATLATVMLYATTPKTNAQYIDAFKTHIEPALIKIPGVASVNVSRNPIDKQVDIEFDPALLVKNSLTVAQVTTILQGLVDRSGDQLSLGAKDYGLLFKGNIALTELANLPISTHNQHIIRLGDIAKIQSSLANEWYFAAIHGHKAMYLRLQPTPDVNALDAIELVKQTFIQLNKNKLSSLDMKITLSRDDSKDIKRALKLVYGSLLIGIVLAAAVLFYFLRNWQVVSLVFISIPVCLSVVMLAMRLSGYSLNVISLAGMALAVGLLLDAAIGGSGKYFAH